MKTFLTVDLTNRTASLGGSDWKPPVLAFGEALTLALRFTENIEGADVERSVAVHSLKAGVGLVDARPERGTTRLKIGDAAQSETNTTAAFNFNAEAADLETKINALTAITGEYGPAVVTWADGSYDIVFGDGSQLVPLALVENKLLPISYGRVFTRELDGVWTHTLRLTQAPVAFTSINSRVLPEAPSIARIQAGGSSDNTEWNEIQELTLPPEFRGTYQLKRGYGRTIPLSKQDGPDEISAALNTIVSGGFSVSNPLPFKARIEFTGDLAGASQDLLEVVPQAQAEGDLTFTLNFRTGGLAAMLRMKDVVTLPLEVLLGIEDEDDAETIREVVAFRADITIRRDAVFDELEESWNIDWLRPPSPEDYIPFSPDQVITGSQHYSASFGDGSASEFSFAHNLGTEALHVSVRQNIAGGLLLNPDAYSVTIDSDNEITVTIAGAATGVNALAVLITSAGPASVFQNHTHTIGQIAGLEARLEAVEEIASLLPTSNPGIPSTSPSSQKELVFGIPALSEVFPGHYQTQPTLPEDLATLNAAILPTNQPGLLPAVHASSTTSYTSGALPALAAGTVWQNNSSAALLVPTGFGNKKDTVPVAGYFASDGRCRYRVTKQGATATYNPTVFERELFTPIFLNGDKLRVGRTFKLELALIIRMVTTDPARRAQARWQLLIEHGVVTAASSPGTPGMNLAGITWNATPILSETLTISDIAEKHRFGIAVARTASALQTDAMKYDYWTGGTGPSVSNVDNLAFRARLINFDTTDGLADPRGRVALLMPIGSEATFATII
jgi:hypothetical protein